MIGPTKMKMIGKTMSKNIIIFGCDNSGKTTLASNLKSLMMGAVLFPPLGPANLDQQKAYLKRIRESKFRCICDRFPPIEEMVCGNVLRGTSNFKEDDLKEFLDCQFIWCNPSFTSILNWGEREQMKGVKENIVPLYLGYLKIFMKLKALGADVFEYNWEKEEEFKNLCWHINERGN